MPTVLFCYTLNHWVELHVSILFRIQLRNANVKLKFNKCQLFKNDAFNLLVFDNQMNWYFGVNYTSCRGGTSHNVCCEVGPHSLVVLRGSIRILAGRYWEVCVACRSCPCLHAAWLPLVMCGPIQRKCKNTPIHCKMVTQSAWSDIVSTGECQRWQNYFSIDNKITIVCSVNQTKPSK